MINFFLEGWSSESSSTDHCNLWDGDFGLDDDHSDSFVICHHFVLVVVVIPSTFESPSVHRDCSLVLCCKPVDIVVHRQQRDPICLISSIRILIGLGHHHSFDFSSLQTTYNDQGDKQTEVDNPHDPYDCK